MRDLLTRLSQLLPDSLDKLGWDGGVLAIVLALLMLIVSVIRDEIKKRFGEKLKSDHVFLFWLGFGGTALVAAAQALFLTTALVATMALGFFLYHRWRPVKRIAWVAGVGLLVVCAAGWGERELQRQRAEKSRDAETVYAVLTFTAPGQNTESRAALLERTKEFHELLRQSLSAPETIFRPEEFEDDVLISWQIERDALKQLEEEGRTVDIVLQNSTTRLGSADEVERVRLITKAKLPLDSLGGSLAMDLDELTVFTDGPDNEFYFMLNHLLLRLVEKLRDSGHLDLDPAGEDEIARGILRGFHDTLVFKALEDSDLARDAAALEEKGLTSLEEVKELMESYRDDFPVLDDGPSAEQGLQLAKAAVSLGFRE